MSAINTYLYRYLPRLHSDDDVNNDNGSVCLTYTTCTHNIQLLRRYTMQVFDTDGGRAVKIMNT